jgi:dUTP pyrophosphatase
MVGACVVDSDYQGEIHIHLVNTSHESANIEAGEKLVQFLLVPVDHCDIEEVTESELFDETTDRGAGGFGSTGVK